LAKTFKVIKKNWYHESKKQKSFTNEFILIQLQPCMSFHHTLYSRQLIWITKRARKWYHRTLLNNITHFMYIMWYTQQWTLLFSFYPPRKI
jgi:hypothetical protein